MKRMIQRTLLAAMFLFGIGVAAAPPVPAADLIPCSCSFCKAYPSIPCRGSLYRYCYQYVAAYCP